MMSSIVIHESYNIDYQPPAQLAFHFAKSIDTVLVNRGSRIIDLKKIPKSSRIEKNRLLIRYKPIHVPQRGSLGCFTKPIADRLWRNEIGGLLLGLSPSMVLFDRPDQHSKVGLLGEKSSVYYAHCDYTVDIIGRRDEKVAAVERMMLRKVDLVLAASEHLAERFRGAGAKRVVHFPCAYNADLFDGTLNYPEPSALAAIPRSRLLFCGYISGRVDFEGLLLTAKARPDWQFVFVGQISEGLEAELVASDRARDLFSQLRSLANVHYLGRFSLAEIPPFMAACDIGLVPYCLSEFTRSSSPIKAFEYLAMGLPVVTTEIPESTSLGKQVFVIKNKEGYEGAIENALTTTNDQVCCEMSRAIASQHSVAARAQNLLELVLAEA